MERTLLFGFLVVWTVTIILVDLTCCGFNELDFGFYATQISNVLKFPIQSTVYVLTNVAINVIDTVIGILMRSDRKVYVRP